MRPADTLKMEMKKNPRTYSSWKHEIFISSNRKIHREGLQMQGEEQLPEKNA